MSCLRKIPFIAAFLSLTLAGAPARLAAAEMKEPKVYDGVLGTLHDSFTGDGLALHLAAMGSTALLVTTGMDGHVNNLFKQDDWDVMAPGYVIGSGLVATAAFIPMFWVGKAKPNAELVGASYAVLQSAALTLSYVTLLKMITGRRAPRVDSPLSSQEQSEGFRFGFGRGGFINGWPSGHVSHTVAVTAALAHYYGDQEWLTWMGVGVSAYVFMTMIMFDSGQMHWFSDVLAGGLMGYSIGSSVGRNLRRVVEGRDRELPALTWSPLAVPNGAGVAATYHLP